MRILMADDTFADRNELLELLHPYGKCDVAVNGKEAVDAFQYALEEVPYNLICLDIVMHKYDGHYALTNIRRYEVQMKIPETKRTKIIMTTGLGDYANVMNSFNEQCDAYLLKPIKEEKLVATLQKLQLI